MDRHHLTWGLKEVKSSANMLVPLVLQIIC